MTKTRGDKKNTWIITEVQLDDFLSDHCTNNDCLELLVIESSVFSFITISRSKTKVGLTKTVS